MSPQSTHCNITSYFIILLVIAHRGYSAKYPENTLKAIQAAVVEGSADGVEFDLHLTSDNDLILQHDDTLDRMTSGSGLVCDFPWNGHVENLKTRGEGNLPISRFRDIYSFLSASDIIAARSEPFSVVIDIKEDQSLHVIDVLADELRGLDFRAANLTVFIGVWTDEFAQRARDVMPPNVRFAWIGKDFSIERTHCGLYDSYNVCVDTITTEAVQEAQMLGKPILVWTCNAEEQVRRGRDLQVNGIITDDPLWARSL